jgi:hypothetical protein
MVSNAHKEFERHKKIDDLRSPMRVGVKKYQKRAVSPRSFGVSGIMEVVAHE